MEMYQWHGGITEDSYFPHLSVFLKFSTTNFYCLFNEKLYLEKEKENYIRKA